MRFEQQTETTEAQLQVFFSFWFLQLNVSASLPLTKSTVQVSSARVEDGRVMKGRGGGTKGERVVCGQDEWVEGRLLQGSSDG